MKTLTAQEIQDLVDKLNPKIIGRTVKEPHFHESRTDVAAVEICWGGDIFSKRSAILYGKI